MNGVGPGRFARVIASAASGYIALWAAVRVWLDGADAPSWFALALLCAAYLVARLGRRRLGAPRAVAAMAMASTATVIAVGAHTGPLEIGDAWSTAELCCIALLVIWRGRHLVAWTGVVASLGALWLLDGFLALQDLGAIVCVLLLAVIVAADRTLEWYAQQLREYAETEQEAGEWRAAQDAYQVAHQERIHQTARLAEQMLRRIAETDGPLDAAHRVECRLLHQAIRDETRGRRLLNDAVREQVMRHRRRGAVVQLLDDGDLDGLDAAELDGLLDRVAEQIAPLHSDRLIIRSAAEESEVAITVVATSADPVAAALGQDDDDHVDLWLELPRPDRTGARVPVG